MNSLRPCFLRCVVAVLYTACAFSCVAQDESPEESETPVPEAAQEMPMPPASQGKQPLTELPDDGRYDHDYMHKYATAAYELRVPGKYLVHTRPDGRNSFQSFARHILGPDPKGTRTAPPILYLAKPAEGETPDTAPAFTIVTVRKGSSWDASPTGGLKEKLIAFHEAAGLTAQEVTVSTESSPDTNCVRFDYTLADKKGASLPVTRMLLPAEDLTHEIIVHRKARETQRMDAEVLRILEGFRRYGEPRKPVVAESNPTGTSTAAAPPPNRWTRIAAWTGGAFILGLFVHPLLTRLGKAAKT